MVLGIFFQGFLGIFTGASSDISNVVSSWISSRESIDHSLGVASGISYGDFSVLILRGLLFTAVRTL